MFEQILQRILGGLGASDGVIATMGPTITIILSMASGGALAQFLKFPLSRAMQEPWFSWTVRAMATLGTVLFAHTLSSAVPLWLEIGAGLLQPLCYHASLALIRRFWPWLETRKVVGSVKPPASAVQAQAQREADRAGLDSGAP
jgi:hypothetical protein